MAPPLDLVAVTYALEGAGCVAAADEAEELLRAARDDGELQRMLSRRLTGEPIAWITGQARFCHLDLAIDSGVYVPRWQSEPLALLAAGHLPPAGIGVDLCTGAGAIGLVMLSRHPDAHVVGTEIDPLAANCARGNGLVVYEGDLDDALPAELAVQVDVMTGVLPYVPRDAFAFLPRDVRRFEPHRALDGGIGGLQLVSTAIRRSPRWVKPGGWLLLEVGSDQVASVVALFGATPDGGRPGPRAAGAEPVDGSPSSR